MEQRQWRQQCEHRVWNTSYLGGRRLTWIPKSSSARHTGCFTYSPFNMSGIGWQRTISSSTWPLELTGCTDQNHNDCGETTGMVLREHKSILMFLSICSNETLQLPVQSNSVLPQWYRWNMLWQHMYYFKVGRGCAHNFILNQVVATVGACCHYS